MIKEESKKLLDNLDISYHIKDNKLMIEHQILKTLHQILMIVQLERPQTPIQRTQEILNKNVSIL